MTKYEIKTDRFEFRFGKSKDSVPAMSAGEIFDEYLNLDGNCPELKASYDTLEDARAAFVKHYANYGTTYAQASNVFWLLLGDVAWIEENEYNEYGEFEQGSDIHDFSAEAYVPAE